MNDEDEKKRRVSGLTGVVKKAIESAVNNPSSLPKDTFSYLLQQGDKGRKEVFRVVAKEVGEFLRHTDLASELIKVLTSIKVEAQVNLSFRPRMENEDHTPDISVNLSESSD